MAEQLRVDSALWNGTAVDGKVLLATSWRVVVDDTWNDFFSHSAFGATCKATSITWFKASQLPTMLYRCLVACKSELFIQLAKLRIFFE